MFESKTACIDIVRFSICAALFILNVFLMIRYVIYTFTYNVEYFNSHFYCYFMLLTYWKLNHFSSVFHKYHKYCKLIQMQFLNQGSCSHGKPGKVMEFEWLISRSWEVMEIFRYVISHGKRKYTIIKMIFWPNIKRDIPGNFLMLMWRAHSAC